MLSLPAILVLFQFILPVLSGNRQAYMTAYGCEGMTLSLSCPAGRVINVIRANYGRFSITICNAHGNTEWSVNCHSPQTHRVLVARCSGREQCNVIVESRIFGNPCPGTFKYIEVHYSCYVAIATTTERHHPPWLTSPSPVWSRPPFNRSVPLSTASSSTTQSATLSHSLKANSATTYLRDTLVTANRTREPIIATTEMTDRNAVDDLSLEDEEKEGSSTSHPIPTLGVLKPNLTLNSSVKSSVVAFESDKYDSPWCPPTFERGLYWNWTKGGEESVQACPTGATGVAKRKCHPSGLTDKTDLSQCHSAWLTVLEARASSQDSALSVATDLAKVVQSSDLYGGDIPVTIRLMSYLSQRMLEDIKGFPESKRKRAVVTELLLSTLTTGSALLSLGLTGAWADLDDAERKSSVSQLMISLEEVSFLLASTLPSGAESVHHRSHILSSVKVVEKDSSYVLFPSAKDQDIHWEFPDWIRLPTGAIFENGDSPASVVFLTYRHMEDLLRPHSAYQIDHNGQKVQKLVNSRILSASLSHGRHIQLSKPVTMGFYMLRQENVHNPTCAFWDYTTASWNEEGCWIRHSNRSHIECYCHHLTNFAVLVDETIGTIEFDSEAHLKILIYVGCVICSLCLCGSLCISMVFRGIVSVQTAIHRNVCLCLLLAELVFLLGIYKTAVPLLCGLIAGALHYIILAAFSWMFMEAIFIYLAVIKPSQCELLRLYWWHYSLVYGLPVLVVGTAASMDPLSYGTSDYCWLRTDNYSVLYLAAPAFLLLAVHLSILMSVLVYTCRITPENLTKCKEVVHLSSSKSWLRGAALLMVLIVMTWSLRLLFLHWPTLPIAASFCIINSLHGILSFIHYCFNNKKVQDWCASRQDQEALWLLQVCKVFATKKQTYSPSNSSQPVQLSVSHACANTTINQVALASEWKSHGSREGHVGPSFLQPRGVLQRHPHRVPGRPAASQFLPQDSAAG